MVHLQLKKMLFLCLVHVIGCKNTTMMTAAKLKTITDTIR